MLIPITTSVTDIPQRLKEIDPNYYLVLNTSTQGYELHHSKQIGGTLCLNFPYDEIDARMIEYTRSKDIKYAKKLFAEMDRNNDKIVDDAVKEMQDGADWKIKEIHKYVNNHESQDVIPDDSYSTRWT